MEKITDWNELARSVSTVVRYLRPLIQLEKMPEAVEAARIKVAECDEAIKIKTEQIKVLEAEVKKVGDDLAAVNKKYQAKLKIQEEVLEAAHDKAKTALDAEIAEMGKSLESAKKNFNVYLESIKTQKEELNKELALVKQEISDKRYELQQLQEKIKVLLG